MKILIQSSLAKQVYSNHIKNTLEFHSWPLRGPYSNPIILSTHISYFPAARNIVYSCFAF